MLDCNCVVFPDEYTCISTTLMAANSKHVYVAFNMSINVAIQPKRLDHRPIHIAYIHISPCIHT